MGTLGLAWVICASMWGWKPLAGSPSTPNSPSQTSQVSVEQASGSEPAPHAAIAGSTGEVDVTPPQVPQLMTPGDASSNAAGGGVSRHLGISFVDMSLRPIDPETFGCEALDHGGASVAIGMGVKVRRIHNIVVPASTHTLRFIVPGFRPSSVQLVEYPRSGPVLVEVGLQPLSALTVYVRGSSGPVKDLEPIRRSLQDHDLVVSLRARTHSTPFVPTEATVGGAPGSMPLACRWLFHDFDEERAAPVPCGDYLTVVDCDADSAYDLLLSVGGRVLASQTVVPLQQSVCLVLDSDPGDWMYGSLQVTVEAPHRAGDSNENVPLWLHSPGEVQSAFAATGRGGQARFQRVRAGVCTVELRMSGFARQAAQLIVRPQQLETVRFVPLEGGVIRGAIDSSSTPKGPMIHDGGPIIEVHTRSDDGSLVPVLREVLGRETKSYQHRIPPGHHVLSYFAFPNIKAVRPVVINTGDETVVDVSTVIVPNVCLDYPPKRSDGDEWVLYDHEGKRIYEEPMTDRYSWSLPFFSLDLLPGEYSCAIQRDGVELARTSFAVLSADPVTPGEIRHVQLSSGAK